MTSNRLPLENTLDPAIIVNYSYILDPTNYNREIERLETFRSWAISFLSASEMAKAGFIYTLEDDLVRCAFCSVEIRDWLVGDVPMKIHLQCSPNCRFVRNMDVGNRALIDNPDLEKMFNITLSEPADESLTIEKLNFQHNILNVKHRKYSTYKARLDSYTNWPRSLPIRPHTLSDAGFFYTDIGDRVICYCCGGALKNWFAHNIPWEEHAKFFSKCAYLLMSKGRDFVESCSEIKSEESKSEVVEDIKTIPTTENICKICLLDEMCILFIPCGHIATCVSCALLLEKCPICRKKRLASMRVFLS